MKPLRWLNGRPYQPGATPAPKKRKTFFDKLWYQLVQEDGISTSVGENNYLCFPIP